ncbi:MAG: MFS transporter [Phycisphaerales bacterium]|nr:MFS transporter [Phycisphaerales bacterium]
MDSAGDATVITTGSGGEALAGDADEAAPPPASVAARPRLGVLRHRHYRNIWLSAFVSNIGGWMEAIGIQWVMTEMSQTPQWVAAGHPSSEMMMGYLGAAQLGPTLVLGIVGGLTADRVNRKVLLLVTQAMLMLVAGFLMVSAFADILSPALLLCVSLANGITIAFNFPAWQVLTPRLVPREELTAAINLNGIQFNMARVVGPALGGVLLHLYGSPVLFAINTASFLVILFAVSGTPSAPAPPSAGASPWQRTAEAARFVWTHRGAFRVMLGLVVFSALAGPLLRMLPVFVSKVYHANEDTFGVMLAVMGGGAVLGGLSMRFVPAWYPKHHFIPLSMMLGGLFLTGFAVATSLGLAAAMIFICGVMWMWTFNSSMAALQLLVDDRMRGRVMSLCNTVVFGAMPLGSLLAGLIGELASGSSGDGFGVQVGVGSMAVALAICGLVMLIWRTPEIDDLPPTDPGYTRRPGLLRGVTAAAHRPR